MRNNPMLIDCISIWINNKEFNHKIFTAGIKRKNMDFKSEIVVLLRQIGAFIFVVCL